MDYEIRDTATSFFAKRDEPKTVIETSGFNRSGRPEYRNAAGEQTDREGNKVPVTITKTTEGWGGKKEVTTQLQEGDPAKSDPKPTSQIVGRVTEPTNARAPVGDPLKPIGSNPKKNNGKDKLGRGETDSPEDFDKLIDALYQKAIEPFSVDYDSINQNSLSQIE